jgi:hypothetical protein
LAVERGMSGAHDAGQFNLRIISATQTTSPFFLGSTVGRVCRTIIAFGIFTIDVLRIGEDQMATNGTLFKGEVPMTHLLFDLSFEKSEEATRKTGPEHGRRR